MNFDPMKHFCDCHRATIEVTNNRQYVYEDLVASNLHYSQSMTVDRTVRMENQISITMGETDYNRFMRTYSKYIELLYAVDSDSQLREMYSKLLIMIELKK